MTRALTDGAPMPDTDAAQRDCKGGRDLNVTQPITPTDQLSAAGRAMFRGVKLTADGIEPVLAERKSAINSLNAMQPGARAATRNLNGNLKLGAYVPAAGDANDLDTASQLFEAFGSEH